MGQTLSQPVTSKQTIRASDKNYKVGWSSMQGWRVSMEDAHAVILRNPYDEYAPFFGVFDGHGANIRGPGTIWSYYTNQQNENWKNLRIRPRYLLTTTSLLHQQGDALTLRPVALGNMRMILWLVAAVFCQQFQGSLCSESAVTGKIGNTVTLACSSVTDKDIFMFWETPLGIVAPGYNVSHSKFKYDILTGALKMFFVDNGGSPKARISIRFFAFTSFTLGSRRIETIKATAVPTNKAMALNKGPTGCLGFFIIFKGIMPPGFIGIIPPGFLAGLMTIPGFMGRPGLDKILATTSANSGGTLSKG
ncbi:unnamed protein product [Nesidiocoris tenuis]|uniref:PPM-type phosphatase domain-containing protein n=1 Tax=Nesidiocoris tenuis TaxID=355587 RepID=A0A6H5H3C2_9HEMI|nr:unnamed protein product [Nesidiocoris tenuis]